MGYKPLSREELISVIEGRSFAHRVPVVFHHLVVPDTFGENKEKILSIMEQYPQDAMIIRVHMPDIYTAPQDDPGYRWVNLEGMQRNEAKGLDDRVAVRDWGQLDEILNRFPDPRYKGLLGAKPADDGRYRLGHWCALFFERHWQFRGMINALTDYYTDPDSVHRLFRALTDFYMAAVERAKKEQAIDGIFVTDDLGMQTGPFFSLEIFNEFFKPYYKELFDKAHSLGLHFWLHSCGCVEKFLPSLIDIGLDIIHPIQKYTMDEKRIAEKYGKDLCIWAGFDVQRIIPWGTPEEVRKEVRFMLDTYNRPEGRLIFATGNTIKGDCPVESFEALHDEVYRYGTEINLLC